MSLIFGSPQWDEANAGTQNSATDGSVHTIASSHHGYLKNTLIFILFFFYFLEEPEKTFLVKFFQIF